MQTIEAMEQKSAKRSLVSIRVISKILPIEKADKIELAVIDGWQVIVKKGEFKPKDLCVYFEIDSLLPVRDEFNFLGKIVKNGKNKGYRIKTIKLRGQLSQGLALPVSTFKKEFKNNKILLSPGVDVTDILGVKKYDDSVAKDISQKTPNNLPSKRNFPSFIPKTDQERIQNLMNYFKMWRGVAFEETKKLHGSSCTIYKVKQKKSWFQILLSYLIFKPSKYRDHIGVCSRNLEFEADEQNNFTYVNKKYHVSDRIPFGYAIQGELIGPKINGNYEKVDDFEFKIFDVYSINERRYLLPPERVDFLTECDLMDNHIPIVNNSIKIFSGRNLENLLKRVDDSSMSKDVISEGRVYKSLDGRISFKVINNKYLLKEK